MNGFGLFLFCLRALFQHHVWSLGLFEVEELNVFSIFECDNGREGRLAQFALELLKIVGSGFLDDFPFDFVVDPVLETVEMDDAASAFAVARIDQGIVLGELIGETDFTGSLKFVFEMENILFGSVDLLEIERFSFFTVVDFDHDQFNPPQLDKVPHF